MIQFHAPFKNAGLGISVLSIMIGGFWIWKSQRIYKLWNRRSYDNSCELYCLFYLFKNRNPLAN